MGAAQGKRAFIGVTSTLIVGSLLVAYGLMERSAALSVQGHFAGEVKQLGDRLTKIEAVLTSTDDRPRDRQAVRARIPVKPGEHTEKFMEEVRQRLDAIELQILAFQPPSAEPTRDGPTPPFSIPNVSELAASQEPQQPHGVSATYNQERGQSEWGTRSQEAIQAQAGTNGFFSQYGGSLATSCKQRTCRVEWALPPLDTLSPEERQEVLGTAEYELMALAAKNAAQASQMSAEWSGEENQPKVAIFLERAEPPE